MLAELLTGKDDGVAGMVAEMTKQHAIMAEALLRQGRDASDRLERLLMAQHALVTQQLAFALNVANAQAAKAATIRPVRPGLGSTDAGSPSASFKSSSGVGTQPGSDDEDVRVDVPLQDIVLADLDPMGRGRGGAAFQPPVSR